MLAARYCMYSSCCAFLSCCSCLLFLRLFLTLLNIGCEIVLVSWRTHLWYSSLSMCSSRRKPGCRSQMWMSVWSCTSVFGVTSFIFAVRMSIPQCATLLWQTSCMPQRRHNHLWSMSSAGWNFHNSVSYFCIFQSFWNKNTCPCSLVVPPVSSLHWLLELY